MDEKKRFRFTSLKLCPLDYLLIVALLLFVAELALSVSGLWADNATVLWLRFFSVSLLANLCLYRLILFVAKVAKITFAKGEWIALAGVMLAVLLFYFITVSRRQVLYYWDSLNYYQMQNWLAGRFELSMEEGIRRTIISVRSDDYTQFICLFTYAFSALLSPGMNGYIVSCALSVFVPVGLMLALAVKKLSMRLTPQRPTLFFVVAFAMCASFPMLHVSLLSGQPDALGVAFLLAIFVLTVDEDFARPSPLRLALLFVVSYALLVTRRWYMFWMIGYYLCYAVSVCVRAIMAKRWRSILWLALFGLASGLVIAKVQYPMLSRILQTDYQSGYAFWYAGGFGVELQRIVSAMGWYWVALAAVGLAYGLVKPKLRALSLSTLATGLIAVYLFTRIQNMGNHQRLAIVPCLLMFIVLAVYGVCSLTKRWLYSAALCVTVAGYALVTLGSYTALPRLLPKKAYAQRLLKTSVNTAPYCELADWIVQNCAQTGDAVYIVPHSDGYNPSKIANVYYPTIDLSQVVPYGSACLGAHAFPTELFDARYVMTTDPITHYGYEDQLNEVFLAQVERGHFVLIKSIDMLDGFTTLIFERAQPVDRDEIQAYRAAMQDETARYPELYGDVIDAYEAEHAF